MATAVTAAAPPLDYVFPPTPALIQCPYAAYTRLRERQPVLAVGDELRHYVVSRYDDVKQVARDAATFSSTGSRTGLNGFGFTGEGPTKNVLEADPREDRHPVPRGLAVSGRGSIVTRDAGCRAFAP